MTLLSNFHQILNFVKIAHALAFYIFFLFFFSFFFFFFHFLLPQSDEYHEPHERWKKKKIILLTIASFEAKNSSFRGHIILAISHSGTLYNGVSVCSSEGILPIWWCRPWIFTRECNMLYSSEIKSSYKTWVITWINLLQNL